ncbi:hypothetical protein VTJ04DRAFT_1994 [Mycothermus thermophilus]|uniref:uncharacterized protein n=1 Tax=Humicola insolens TaxID=85995 RepID=UPI00374350EF
MTRALRAARPLALAASRCASSAAAPIRSLCFLQQRPVTPATKANSQPAGLPRRFGTTAVRATDKDTEDVPPATADNTRDFPPDYLPTPEELANPDTTPEDPSKPLKYRRTSRDGVVRWDRSFLRFRYHDEDWDDEVVFSTLWLRDSCECPRCVDPHSGQKTFSTTDLPLVPALKDAIITPGRHLQLTFAADPVSGGEDHVVVYPYETILDWRTAGGRWNRYGFTSNRPENIPWDKASYTELLANGRCRVSYKDWLNDDKVFFNALKDLSQTGLIFVTDVPQDEKSVEHIATRIGPLMYTFYGWTWDVKSKPQAENVAYTNVFLGLHQDLMYHDPIPGLQLLHCLANDCSGGESLFSNGLRAAYELKINEPGHYDVLRHQQAWFGYRRNGNHYFARRKTIATTLDGWPTSVAWAPPFQTTFPLTTTKKQADAIRRWRIAAKRLQEVMEQERNVFEIKMKPGECVIFDNQRVLHGRREFDAGSTGSRWLKGAYITMQAFQAAQTRMVEHWKETGREVPPPKVTYQWSENYVRERMEELDAQAKS